MRVPKAPRHVPVSLLLVVFALAATALIAGTAAGQTDGAPDCATVSYEGEGTESEPYEVSDVDGLACIGNSTTETRLNGSFSLVSDINATVTSSWNEGRGFEPIGRCIEVGNGSCEGEAFSGALYGNGRSITGLYIDRPDENMTGMFGGIDAGGVVTNLTLEDVNVTGGDFNRVGSLVAASVGTVDGVRVTGEVTGENFNVGGVVGANDGDVVRSYADVKVEGVAAVGGLIGNTGSNSTVERSYAAGDVLAERRAGGLVGRNIGLVSDTYATGNVTATVDQAGGLTGSNQRNGTVRRSFAVGPVNGTASTGGISGRLGAGEGEIGAELAQGGNETSSLVNVYWDSRTTGQSEAVGERAPGEGEVRVENAVGLTSDEMRGEVASESMDGLAFNGTWVTGDGYPTLAWQAEPDEGTSEEVEDTEDTEGNETDGGNGDGRNTTDRGSDENEDNATNNATDEAGDGEGLPGFGVFAALLALTVVFARRLS
jgi:hypothetical protein